MALAPKYNLNSALFTRVQSRTHGWTRKFNDNMIRMGMLFNTAIKAPIGTALPETADEGDIYVDPSNQRLSMWVESFDEAMPGVDNRETGWFQLTPQFGHMVYVVPEEKYYLFNWAGEWELAIDLNAEHRAVEREFSFYAPGKVRPSATMFHYIASLELTIESNAPGSFGILDTAPTGHVLFSMFHNTTEIGYIAFQPGSTEALITCDPVIIQPAHIENLNVSAQSFSITSPEDLYGASGLAVTIRGKIRAID